MNVPMRLREIKNIFHIELSDQYPKEEIDSFFYLSIEHHLGLERFILALQPGLSVSKEEEDILFGILHRLKLQEPIQYILGETYFKGLRFKLNRSVLIPRPETEELVNWVLEDYGQAEREISVLDIGTGSGCIAISLAKLLPTSKVIAIDKYREALAVAEENAEVNKVDVVFKLLDISDPEPLKMSFDIIISNPPYVRQSEKSQMKKNVTKYEPGSALFVPENDPLIFYRHILKFALKKLRPGGSIYLELNQYLADDTRALFDEKKFSEIELRKDMFDNKRMLKITSGPDQLNTIVN